MQEILCSVLLLHATVLINDLLCTDTRKPFHVLTYGIIKIPFSLVCQHQHSFSLNVPIFFIP